MGAASEAGLYAPIKRFLEARGYEVKGEVCGCELVARRGDEPPVIVELKLRFSLALLLQGVDRLAVSERVCVAVPRRSSRPASHPPSRLASRPPSGPPSRPPSGPGRDALGRFAEAVAALSGAPAGAPDGARAVV